MKPLWLHQMTIISTMVFSLYHSHQLSYTWFNTVVATGNCSEMLFAKQNEVAAGQANEP